MTNPIPAPYRWLAWLVLVISALVGAAALGWWLGQPKPVQETAAPAQRQADGSLVLERKPDAAAKPKQQIPPKAKLERVAQVTVQPSAAPAGEPCPPVSVDMSLVRNEDGSRRMLASSPDGTIVGGVDVPVESAAPPEAPPRWAAGLSWSHAKQTGGMWIERDVPLFSKVVRIGAEVNQDRIDQDATGIDARLRVGFAF
jgi:hypothetical protein